MMNPPRDRVEMRPWVEKKGKRMKVVDLQREVETGGLNDSFCTIVDLQDYVSET